MPDPITLQDLVTCRHPYSAPLVIGLLALTSRVLMREAIDWLPTLIQDANFVSTSRLEPGHQPTLILCQDVRTMAD